MSRRLPRKRLDLLPNYRDTSLIRCIELQHSCSEEIGTESQPACCVGVVDSPEQLSRQSKDCTCHSQLPGRRDRTHLGLTSLSCPWRAIEKHMGELHIS